MLDADQVLPLLLAACPTLTSVVDADELAVDEDGRRLPYMVAGAAATHWVELLHTGATDEFPATFGVLERLLVEGDDDVRNLVVVGYLEGIQNVSSHRSDVHVEDFVHYLGPESHRAWDELNAFWGA